MKILEGIIFDLGLFIHSHKRSNKRCHLNLLVIRFKYENGFEMNFQQKMLINKLNANELENIFKFFGEEKDITKRIANNIIIERKSTQIDTRSFSTID